MEREISVENRILKLKEWAKDNAVNCIFPFWTSDFIVDKENGGFYGRITKDMEIDNEEPRGLTLMGRMLYAFSTAYLYFRDPLYLEKATYTYNYLMERFYDETYGGAYISVSKTGEVLDDSKPNYCEAFFIMGLSSYFKASGDEKALKVASESFHIMEEKVKFGPSRYHGNMSRDFKPVEGMGFGRRKGPSFPEGAVMFPHHLYQAYVQLFEATDGLDGCEKLHEEVRASLKEMTHFAVTDMYEPETRMLKTIVGKDGSRIGSHQSYGHDAEISYLAYKAAVLVGDPELLATTEKVCRELVDQIETHDFDPYHSMYNGEDLETHYRDPKHVWWAQAEAVTSMFFGYELTGEERYLTACEKQVEFIDQYFVNREYGDWYNNIVVDEEGGHVVDGMHGLDKLNGGKCPFHNSQMCFEMISRADRLLGGKTE